MKKLNLFFVIFMFACVANAQIFVGGSIGVGLSKNKNEEGARYSQDFNIGIAPEVGYSINSKIDVGLDLVFDYQNQKSWLTPGDKDAIVPQNVYSWAVAPFAQYHFAKWKKLDFLLRGTAMFGSDFYKEMDIMPFYYQFSVSPIVHFALNDHFVLFTNLNFISLNIGGSFAKDMGRSFNFSFGADTGNAFNLGAVRVGFFYKF